jgi:hypothetical protein
LLPVMRRSAFVAVEQERDLLTCTTAARPAHDTASRTRPLAIRRSVAVGAPSQAGGRWLRGERPVNPDPNLLAS